MQDEREACEAFLQGQGEVSEGVDQEVLSPGRGGSFCLPVKGEVYRGEAFRKVPGRILGPEGGEGGEGLQESG